MNCEHLAEIRHFPEFSQGVLSDYMKASDNEKAEKAWNLTKEERLFIRAIKCNREACRACPHAYYAYARRGYGKQRKQRYLGPCNQIGLPRVRYTEQLFAVI